MKSKTRKSSSPAPLLPKSPMGIQGLDEITGGGLPRGRPTRVFKSAPRVPVARPKGRRAPVPGKYILRLYVAGATVRSRQAVLRVRHLCKTELLGHCDLEVIDIFQQPKRARQHQIVATPTLVVEFPRPMRRFIGNLMNTADLVIKLELDAQSRLTP